MKNKESATANRGRFVVLTVLAACLVLSLGVLPAPVLADDSSSLVASVTVMPPIGESYGARVIGASRAVFVSHALGGPDGKGAWTFERGWVSIELESMVRDCRQVSIWAANMGWTTPRFAVYTSEDGRRWRLAGHGNCSSYRYTEYSFSGAYGDVRYIKVVLKETPAMWLTVMALDALGAKGGDN